MKRFNAVRNACHCLFRALMGWCVALFLMSAAYGAGRAVDASLPDAPFQSLTDNFSILEDTTRELTFADLRDKFFEKYSTAGKLGGTGLGTYSSHLLARVQGGSLTMETSESSGTTLTLMLNHWQGGESVAAADEVATLTDQRVLVVDDDEFTRMILLDQLAQSASDVKFACNGSEALEIITHWRPDVIVPRAKPPLRSTLDSTVRQRTASSGTTNVKRVLLRVMPV
jgi:CheY-like chemotaxis protein